MNAMCIIYPQSWLQLKVEHIFFTLLNIMKVPKREHSFFIIENYMNKNIRSHIWVKLGKNSISSIIRTCLLSKFKH
jgi:CO dehydrogenase/acetyl-CoA synthase beta subunit